MKEFLESEQSYVYDLDLWEKDFRKEILNMDCIQSKEKYFLNEHLFTNLSEIAGIHKFFMKEMKRLNYELLVEHNKVKGKETKPAEDFEELFVLPLDEDVDVNLIEYATTYLVYFPQATYYYLEYIKLLPYSIYEFEKLMKSNKEFAKAVNAWLEKNNVSQLGVNNFFFRPLTKASRYSILFKAIQKRCLISRNVIFYDDVLLGLKNANELNDLVYSTMDTYFKTYTMMNLLQFRLPSQNIFSLKLIDKSTKIVCNKEIIVKKSIIQPASYKNIFVLDKILLICNIRDDQFQKLIVDTTPIFLSKCVLSKERMPFFDKVDKLEKYWPFYIIQKDSLNIKGLYFTDEYTRNATYDEFKQMSKDARPFSTEHEITMEKYKKFDCQYEKISCILEQSENLEKNTKMMYELDQALDFSHREENENTPQNDVDSSAVEWKTNFDIKDKYLSTSAKSSQRLKSMFASVNKSSRSVFEKFYKERLVTSDENLNKEDEKTNKTSIDPEDMEGQQTVCCNFFSSPGIFYIKLVFPVLIKPVDNEMTLFSTDEGIFKYTKGQTVKLWNKKADKMLYDEEFQLVMLQIKNKLYISNLNADSKNIKAQEINIDITDFYYGKVKENTYIIICVKGEFDLTLLYLFSIEFVEDYIQVKYENNLYVSDKVNDISYFFKKMVISSKEFEIVDSQTLRTQSLIETYDSYTNAFSQQIDNMVAQTIFQIDEDTFLLCYNGVGFYVDATGRYKYSHICFNWEDVGQEFRIYKKFIVVLSKFYLSVFELETGKLVHQKSFSDGKFVVNSKELLFFNCKGMFTLNIKPKKKETKLKNEDISVLDKKHFPENYTHLTATESDDRYIKQFSKKPKIRKFKVTKEITTKELKEDSKKDLITKNLIDKELLVDESAIVKTNTVPTNMEICKENTIDVSQTNDGNILSVQLHTKRTDDYSIDGILDAYQEKYKNYQFISLKLVSKNQ